MNFKLLVGTINRLFFDLLVIVSLFDLIGNIAGDIRDSKKDTIAGVRTLVTVFGLDNTVQIMVYIFFSIFSFLVSRYSNPSFVFLFLFNLIPFFLVYRLPSRLSHATFHLAKLINFLSISFILSHVSVLAFITCTCLIVTLWFISYYFYLYHPNPITN